MLSNFQALCQNKILGVIKTVGGLIYMFRKASWALWHIKCMSTAVNIYMNVKITYNDFICYENELK